ncbi:MULTISPECIES: hypothetical protein [unclassified Mesorhizobium]|uniref:hypothetical protein n=1 Tax=unclassified Mesorhizobium TaxID=325217 RepID=UPI0003CF79AC|nr:MULTISPECIES: hypothetical protein [unclassified Mesorhizobium]ESY51576.1 hypothetical protein X745_22420 [Mesorhizobium sp. LNJC374B00]ESY58459.1 hypothetical protein X744_16935 [Mesorhizobium sp. LNJC372A00]WJI78958.1 hypothetical protein NLY34_18965 [Mesorhizobium sp. C374B]WJI85492.1 hypothetical protein NLY42_21365 [Mesorhizobium sp. C372A]
MARTKPSKQLSQDEIDRVLAAAETLYKSIVRPLLSYNSEHYQALREVHRPLLKSIETITGQKAQFIKWNGTGPASAARAVVDLAEILT